MKLKHLAFLVLAGFGAFYIFHMVMHHKGAPLNPLAGA